MENNWRYCEKGNHNYSVYINALGHEVCGDCDPLGAIWSHSPLAKAEVARVLEMDVQWFEENPVWFLDEGKKAVGFKDIKIEVEYTCPYCDNFIDWYPVNRTLKWRCNC